MRTRSALTLVSLAFGLAACDGCSKPKPEPSTAPSASASASAASAAPSASTPASAEATADAGAKAGNMAHCPSSVPGANTVFKDGKDSLVIAVTATDAAATADVRSRAKFLAEQAKNASPEVKHTGSGEGGGAFGRCPVVMRNTTVEAKDVEGGAELTVKPKDVKELDWLRRESRERLSELKVPGAASAGQGKMAHCPSAIPNSKTTVKDIKEGVEVSVVARDTKDQPTEKEIRERGKAIVAASKSDPDSVQHKGDGSGGGGFGRCPLVLKNTTIESKDVPGGAIFTVKAKGDPAIAELRKEAKERADNFK
jgi:hypothetical protein